MTTLLAVSGGHTLDLIIGVLAGVPLAWTSAQNVSPPQGWAAIRRQAVVGLSSSGSGGSCSSVG